MAAPDIDQAAKIAGHPATASLAGAVVGLRFIPGATAWARLANACGGASVSYYVAPAFAGYLHLDARGTSALAFVLGLVGISLADGLVQGVRSTKWGEIIESWITRRS